MVISETNKKPRFIKPLNILKNKVGSGGIDEKLIEGGQKLIDECKIDFSPYAKEFLEELQEIIRQAQTAPQDFESLKESLIAPVMKLKANGGMFGYMLVSDVADIALNFLETIVDFNEDAIRVLQAHENTMEVIIQNQLTGSGGKEGHSLVNELDSVCKRYFKKHKEK